MRSYEDHGPVKCDVDFDTSRVKNLMAVVTGGAHGIGEAYVKALSKAGAFVVFGDINEQDGKRVEAEAGQNTQFLRCDVREWQDQLSMFKRAIANSPNHKISIVIANAGISGFDDVFHNNLDLEEPEEPQMNIIKTNGLGVLYTTKLALHYFRRQFKLDPDASHDQVLILQGSLAGYLDYTGATQYSFAKYGMRSIMRNLRRSETVHNIRVNYIAPTYSYTGLGLKTSLTNGNRFVRTGLLSETVIKHLEANGTEWATVESAARAVMKICSDTSINGRAFTVTPQTWFESGYHDLDSDDYREGLLKQWTESSLKGKHRELSKGEQQVEL